MHIPGLYFWRSNGMGKNQELLRWSYSHTLNSITWIRLFSYPPITEFFLYFGQLFTYFKFTLLKLMVFYQTTTINLYFSFFMFIKTKILDKWNYQQLLSAQHEITAERERVSHSFSYTGIFWQFLMISLHFSYVQQKQSLPFQKKEEGRKEGKKE